jgi:hypothetical protein
MATYENINLVITALKMAKQNGHDLYIPIFNTSDSRTVKGILLELEDDDLILEIGETLGRFADDCNEEQEEIVIEEVLSKIINVIGYEWYEYEEE